MVPHSTQGLRSNYGIVEIFPGGQTGQVSYFGVPPGREVNWAYLTDNYPPHWNAAAASTPTLRLEGIDSFGRTTDVLALALGVADIVNGGQDESLHYYAGGAGATSDLLGLTELQYLLNSQNPYANASAIGQTGRISALSSKLAPLARVAGGTLSLVGGSIQYVQSAGALLSDNLTIEQRVLTALNGVSGALLAGGGALMLTGAGAPVGAAMMAAGGLISAGTWIYEHQEQLQSGLQAWQGVAENAGVIVQALPGYVQDTVLTPAVEKIENFFSGLFGGD